MRKSTVSSLLNSRFLSLNSSYSVFTHNSRGEVVRVAIPTDTKTVIDAIQVAIFQFNRTKTADLQENLQNYELYAAKPNGTRYKQYPSLDGSQNLALTNMNDFYLKQNNKSERTTGSVNIKQPRLLKIASDFDQMKRPQLKTKKNQKGCFFFCS